MFLEQVEIHRPLVVAVLESGKYPFPPELILALIQYESGGQIGAINPESNASGLMQVMPRTFDFFKNSNRNTAIQWRDLQSNQKAFEQISVGAWVLGHYWRQSFKYLREKNNTDEIFIPELARFSDAFYAAGPKTVKDLSAKISPLTWSAFAATYPNSNITKHVNKVLLKTETENPAWNLAAVNAWVTTENGRPITPPPTQKQGALVGILIFAIAFYVFRSFFKGSSIGKGLLSSAGKSLKIG